MATAAALNWDDSTAATSCRGIYSRRHAWEECAGVVRTLRPLQRLDEASPQGYRCRHCGGQALVRGPPHQRGVVLLLPDAS